MAFFGLTALGYQDTFHVSSLASTNLHVFEENDFRSAWNRATGSATSCEGDVLNKVFVKLYHGPVPPQDADMLSQAFDGGIMSVEFDKYMEIMMELREKAIEIEEDPCYKKGSTCDVSTNSEFLDSIKRHVRPSRDLQQKQVVPLTSLQEVSQLLSVRKHS